jgi:hypothetical protein
MLAQVSYRQGAITAISYILPILGEVFLQSETIRFLTSPSIRCETSVEEKLSTNSSQGSRRLVYTGPDGVISKFFTSNLYVVVDCGAI